MDTPCVLCCSKEEDELIFGKVHRQDQVVVHRNCLYLSSNLVQNGNERNGILNFLKKDILKEVRRCRLLRCCYCLRGGANIGCCRRECRRSFHTKCGVDNLAVNQYSGSYNSYCRDHVPKSRYRPGPTEQCSICFDALLARGERFNVAKAVQSPCCRNGWYHHRCLQLYANSAGYFFKCPLCKDEEKFGEVARFGISIPNSDASWELEPNAFADQLQRAQDCTAPQCRLRKSTTRVGGADLLYCIMCGSNPMHACCTDEKATTYRCADCIVVAPSIPAGAAADSDEEEEADDVFERMAELLAHQHQHRGRDNTRDLRHSKLVASVCVASESDEDEEDDDEVFDKVADIQNQSRLESAAKSSARPPAASLRSRQTLPARIPEQNENRTEGARKRRGSRSPIAPSGSRRFLQPIFEAASSERSNVRAPETRTRASVLRRRTMPYSNRGSNLDESCVANRTRTRLPTYMANKK